MPQLSQPGLRPQASPAASFVQPAASTPTTGQDVTGELLTALSSLAPGIAKLAYNEITPDRVDVIEQQEAAAGKIGGMTFDEARAAVKDGTLPEMQNPFFRAAFNRQFAQRAGLDAKRRISEALAGQDLTQVDAEGIAKSILDETRAGLPQDKHATAGFTAVTGDIFDTLAAKRTEAITSRTLQVRNDNALQLFMGAVEQAKSTGGSVGKAVRDFYKGNRDFLGMDYATQDRIVVEAMEMLSRQPGNEEALRELGALDRGGAPISAKLGDKMDVLLQRTRALGIKAQSEAIQPALARFHLAADEGAVDVDGQPFEKAWGSFVQANRHLIDGSAEASMIIRHRNAIEAQKNEALQLQARYAKDTLLATLTPDMVEAANAGRVFELGAVRAQVAGKDVEITEKEIREEALARAARQMEERGQAQGRDPEEIRQGVIEMYGRNGEVDPQLRARVNALLNSTTAEGTVPENIAAYLPEISVARRAAPHMVNRLVDNERDRQFLDAMVVGFEMGLPQQDAIRNAVWRRDNADRIQLLQGRDRIIATEGAFDKLVGGGALWGLFGEEVDPVNRALLEPVVSDRLDYWFATGARGDDLLQRVADSIAQTHLYYGGHYIDVSGTGMPKQEVAKVLDEAVTSLKTSRPDLADEDITFIPSNRSGRFYTAVTLTGLPIPDTQRSWEEMRSHRARAQNERRAAQGNAALSTDTLGYDPNFLP